MNWSQLKKQIRSLMCEELSNRVDFHKAVYRNSGAAHADRVWITIDGEEVFELSHAAWTNARSEAERAVTQQHPEADAQTRMELVAAAVEQAGGKPTVLLSQSLRRYLEAPIAASLQSANPVIRAFAMLDRRTGRRTLARITIAPDDPPLVRLFHALRTGTP